MDSVKTKGLKLIPCVLQLCEMSKENVVKFCLIGKGELYNVRNAREPIIAACVFGTKLFVSLKRVVLYQSKFDSLFLNVFIM